MEARLKEILTDILEVHADDINEDFGPKDAALWDSINNLRLITAFEEEFKIRLSMDDIKQMINFEKIREIISRYL